MVFQCDGICQLCVDEPCTCAGDVKWPRYWQKNISQDLGSSNQRHSLQRSRRFGITSEMSRIYSHKRWLVPRVCVTDLNCLTLTFKESLAKNKNSAVVSGGAPLLFLCWINPVHFILNLSGVKNPDQKRPDPLHRESGFQRNSGQRSSQDLQRRAKVRELSHEPGFSLDVKWILTKNAQGEFLWINDADFAGRWWKQRNQNCPKKCSPARDVKLCQCGSLQHRGVPVPGPWILHSEVGEVQIQSERGERRGAEQVHEQRASSATEHICWHHQLTGWRPALWRLKVYLLLLKLTWELPVSSFSSNQWVCGERQFKHRKH